MFKILRHFITITRHRHMVMRYCFRCGLYKQGLLHDLSKYSPSEFFTSAKYYAYGKYSPTTNERNALGYSSVWLHHKGRNKHHEAYWLDISPVTKLYTPIPMPKRYIAESICDRIAASKNYNRKNYNREITLNYFLNEKDRIIMHEDTKKEVEFLLRLYVQYGEKYIFKYLKKNYRKK